MWALRCATTFTGHLRLIRSGEVDHLLIASTLLTTKVRTQVELEDKHLALSFLYFSRVDLPSFESILDQLRSINLIAWK